ncbi:MAG: hypothetical protein NTX65_12245 [Ignavibacteriales bacterium]|nr:hypothetical protein [Ignavibacteriales bacterium]
MEQINGRQLHEKLGIKEGFQIKLINEPENFIDSFNGMHDRVHFHQRLKEPVDLIHLFTRSKKELMVEFPTLKNYLKENGAFWVSWPKRNSNHISDLNHNVVREIGLMNGLIDSKVCSIDENWSALKFIFRTKEK